MNYLKCAPCLMVIALLVVSPVAASPVLTLDDLNSQVKIDAGSDVGMYQWTVDGVNHLYRQWFWYRVGSTGQEQAVSTLTNTKASAYDLPDSNPGNDYAVLEYTSSQFKVQFKYLLSGGLSGTYTSDMAETITITNLTSTALDFHFFQYCDLDLQGSAADDSVRITGGNTAHQWDARCTVAETVVTPLPSHYAVGTGKSLYSLLTDGYTTTLSDSGDTVTGDAEWAFQWDLNIAAKGNVIISKDKNVVPEPASMALLVLGGLLLRRRRA